MVVFSNGASDRSNYRKFKMHHQRNDDTANIHETITRRFSQKNVKSWGLPDLVLIDGGKGQLNAAITARDMLGINVPIVSIAKRDEELLVSKAGSNVIDSLIRVAIIISTST